MKLFQQNPIYKKRLKNKKNKFHSFRVNNNGKEGFSTKFLNYINKNSSRESYITTIVNQYFKSKNEFYDEKYLNL